ncbi:MAG: polysaccharide deacetylase family protein [Deltaproteobacteria bacterium]|nr:polysaccharide deacetylase family protein [Deltaproteobacteria bacterium]
MRNALLLVTAAATSWLQPACTGDEGDEHEDETELFEQAYEDAHTDGKIDGTDCSGVRVPDRTGFNKRIALTFDDGPNPETTPKVISVLEKHGAPATFFTNGSRYSSKAATDLAARIAAHPAYLLANHSQRHINLAQQSAATVATEIDRTDALIRVAGETPRYFRFPFGSSTCGSKQQAQDRSYIVTGWHVDSADWCFAAGGGVCKKSTFKFVPDNMRNDMKAYVLSQVRSFNGGIVLFHDIHQSTADALDGILTALKAEGYTFVRLDDTAAWPKLHGSAPVAQKFIGDKCTTDADCAFTASGKAGACHPAGFCTIVCEGSCPDLAGRAPTFCIADERAANPAGMCVSKAATQNMACASLPDTENRTEPRFIGTSTSTPATANVCAPR